MDDQRASAHPIDQRHGLEDAPRSGRPASTHDVIRDVLTMPLRDPPAEKWTTRAIAEATGVSQTTVSRIRGQAYPPARPGDAPLLADQSALLAFVHIGPSRRILGFYAPAEARGAHQRHRSHSTAVADPLETVLCAALAAGGIPPELPDESTTALLRQATERAPTDRAMTLLLDSHPTVRRNAGSHATTEWTPSSSHNTGGWRSWAPWPRTWIPVSFPNYSR